MARIYNLAAFWIISLFILISPLTMGQTLEDALAADATGFQQSKPETILLWDDLITALEQNDFVNGKALADKFYTAPDFTEPYQNAYTFLVLSILDDENTKALFAEDAYRKE